MTCVIGYGNTLRGEDGFGVHVAERLAGHLGDGVALMSCFQLTPELVPTVAEADRVVFVDASCGTPAYALAAPLKELETVTLSHHLSPHLLIHMAGELYRHTPSYRLFSMLTESFDVIDDPIAYDDAIQRTATAIRSWIGETS